MLNHIARIVRGTYFSRIVRDSRNSRKLGPSRKFSRLPYFHPSTTRFQLARERAKTGKAYTSRKDATTENR
ncbi:MAG: hypothetical protein PV344_05095, partial [Anaplasma sp.]|nr:hypothetical protein [Anaplasma sp.]